jgi:predicted acyltransferase
VKTRALGLALGAAACLASGYLWSIWFPINKKMWTSSYVLVAAGWSLTIFALVFWAVEIKGWGKAAGSNKSEVLSRAAAWPWLVFGSNAIAAYMISELLGGVVDLLPFTAGGQKTDALAWMHTQIFHMIPNQGWAAFGYSFSFMAICFIPVWVLYRKKIFLKV